MATISLISTLTEDVLLNEQEQVIGQAKGGPAYFISSALADESVAFELSRGAFLKVEILVTPKGEFGRVPEMPTPRMIAQNLLKEWTIVSTVLGEWQLPEDMDLPERVFVDLQGFVRDGQNFGGKKKWQVSDRLSRQIFCMKGTAEEVRYLPPEVLQSQKQRLLLVTHGKEGVDMFIKGEHKHFAAEKIEGLQHTVGAGDTLLGHFVARLYKGDSPEAAIKSAVLYVASFLRRENR